MSTRLSKFFIYKVLFGRLNYIKKKEVKSFTVNDFGCGDGMLLRYFNFKKYIGIDLNKSNVCSISFFLFKIILFLPFILFDPFLAKIIASIFIFYFLNNTYFNLHELSM